MRELAGVLRTKPDDVVERVKALIEDRKQMERQLADTRRQLALGGGGAAAVGAGAVVGMGAAASSSVNRCRYRWPRSPGRRSSRVHRPRSANSSRVRSSSSLEAKRWMRSVRWRNSPGVCAPRRIRYHKAGWPSPWTREPSAPGRGPATARSTGARSISSSAQDRWSSSSSRWQRHAEGPQIADGHMTNMPEPRLVPAVVSCRRLRNPARPRCRRRGSRAKRASTSWARAYRRQAVRRPPGRPLRELRLDLQGR